MSLLEYMAPWARTEAVQRAALSDPALHSALARNPDLHLDVFRELYPGNKIPLALAAILVETGFTQDKWEHFLAVETRGSLLSKHLKVWQLNADQRNDLIGHRMLTASVIAAIHEAAGRECSVPWLRAVAPVAGLSVLVDLWGRDPSSATDAEISTALGAVAATERKIPREGLAWLLAERPAVLPAAVHSPSRAVRTVAAGCRHLVDQDLQRALFPPQGATHAWFEDNQWTLMALIHNPAVHPDVVKELAELVKNADMELAYAPAQRLGRYPFSIRDFVTEPDPIKVSWALRRSLPYQGKPGRPHDLVAVLANENLTAESVLFAFRALSSAGTCWEVKEAFDKALTRHPFLTEEHGVHPLTDDGPSSPPRPPDEWPLGPCPVPWPRPEWDEKTIGATRDLGQFHRVTPAVVWYLEKHFGEDVAKWDTAFALVNGGFRDTAAVLVAAVESVHL